MKSNPKEIIKKRNKLLLTAGICVTIPIIAIIILAIVIVNDNLKFGLNLGLLVLVLVIALLFRSKIYTYNNLAKIATLVLRQDKPISYIESIVTHPHKLLTQGFIQVANFERFSMYYRHSKNPSAITTKVFKIEICIIVKDSSLDFYDASIEEEIQKLENTFTRKDRPTKYIILGFKNYESVNEKILKELSEVVCYSVARFHYSQINAAFIRTEKKCYFLYSDSYNPSSYYKQGIDFIKHLCGKTSDLYISNPLERK